MLMRLQGGGEVQLSVPTLRALPPVSLLQEGMVKRVRGVAHSMRVSPQNSNRMVRYLYGGFSDACGKRWC
jgi:RNA 3'-terminal phosphate cyclase